MLSSLRTGTETLLVSLLDAAAGVGAVAPFEVDDTVRVRKRTDSGSQLVRRGR